MRKQYWVLLFWFLIGTPLVVYAYQTMEDRDRAWDLLGIWVVNGVISLFQLALVRWRPKKSPLSWVGAYLVLGPISLMAWFNRSFEMWFIVPLALAGVLVLWFANPRTEGMEAGNHSRVV